MDKEIQQLNEKLARWRWPDAHIYIPRHYPIEIRVRENDITFHQLDFFTNSVDLCFKWLVPKFQWCRIFVLDKEIVVVVDKGTNFGEARCKRDESLALALCRAIEQVIDD